MSYIQTNNFENLLDNRKNNFLNNPYLCEYFSTKEEDDNFEKYSSKIVDDICDTSNNVPVEFENSMDMQEIPIPTNLRVSTMTAICSIQMNLRLDVLFDKIEVTETSSTYPYIRSCQLGTDKIKGEYKKKKNKRKKDISKPSKPKRNYFQNQATLVIVLDSVRKINLKIFRNGKVQMTGLKCKEEGLVACERIIFEIRELSKKFPQIIENPENPELTETETQNIEKISNEATDKISNFSIVLINSDFYGGFKIKREKLYEILFSLTYFVTYEPDIYPGVNAKYFWNKHTKNTPFAGICKCKVPCNGKGNGNGDGDCKKVTIATFQSGNIIITGARNNVQTMDAFNFINSILAKYYNDIVRVLDKEDDEIPKLIKIKGMDITDLEIRNKLIKMIIE